MAAGGALFEEASAINKIGSNDLVYFKDATARSSIDGIKTVKHTTSAFSSLPQTYSNNKITSNHEVVNSVLSNPSAQTGEWTITTTNGSFTISGSISGSTTATLYFNVIA